MSTRRWIHDTTQRARPRRRRTGLLDRRATPRPLARIKLAYQSDVVRQRFHARKLRHGSLDQAAREHRVFRQRRDRQRVSRSGRTKGRTLRTRSARVSGPRRSFPHCRSRFGFRPEKSPRSGTATSFDPKCASTGTPSGCAPSTNRFLDLRHRGRTAIQSRAKCSRSGLEVKPHRWQLR